MTRNSTRPARAFFDFTKDRNYVHSLNTEMQEIVSGTFCFYWAHSQQDTVVDKLYNETRREKIFLSPVKVYAVVENKGQTQKISGSYSEKVRTAKLKFFKSRLREVQLLEPKAGDIVQIGVEYYEILTVTDTAPLWGDMEDMFAFECECEQARPYDVNVLLPAGDR